VNIPLLRLVTIGFDAGRAATTRIAIRDASPRPTPDSYKCAASITVVSRDRTVGGGSPKQRRGERPGHLGA